MDNEKFEQMFNQLLEIPMEVITTDEVRSMTIELLKKSRPEEISEILRIMFLLLSEVASSAIARTTEIVLDADDYLAFVQQANEANAEAVEKELQEMIENFSE